MTTLEKLAGITAQYNEIVKRVANGSLDPVAVRKALQEIIEGNFSESPWPYYNVPSGADSPNWEPPNWWRSTEQQIERAFGLWGDIFIPEPPAEFVPQTETEVLLLHVPRSFDELWEAVQAPQGYTKWRWDELKSGRRYLRLAPNKREFADPVWVAFDPEHGKGKRPDSFWGRSDLAASEVLSAVIQFPDWPLAWFSGASAPNLSGYQFKYDADWSGVPCLRRWDDDSQLKLSARWSDSADSRWASPVVREC